jgi:hypothetical protein
MIKKDFVKLLTFSFLLLSMLSCEDTATEDFTPISPILKEIEMPLEANIMPGQATIIKGLGFSNEDKVYFENEEGITEVEVISVTDSYIVVIVPIEAGGEYTVIIERTEKQTTLDSKIKVPFVVPLTDVELPMNSIVQEGEVYILGKGFQDGDMAILTADFYPTDSEFAAPIILTSEGAKFTLPINTYGINTVLIKRENRQSNLGEITIETNVGDEIGGGVVFWVDANKTHGYIVSKSNVGTPAEQFGPEVTPSDASGTTQEIGSGKVNTQKIIEKMNQLRQLHDWPEWREVKIAAELCNEFSVTDNGGSYSDWFLPSRQELIELFKVKSMLADKGYDIPPNNYWSSSEAEGNAGWAAYYVNFYEETNVVTDIASKSGWRLGVRPIRTY